MTMEFTMVTPLYAGILGLMLVYLSRRIVTLRNKYQIKMGDGGHNELIAATRAQGNLLEYLPTALLLMLMVEILDFHHIVVHILGIALVIARAMHLKGINEPSGKSKMRKLGTRLTWTQMGVASVLAMLGAVGITF